MLLADVVIGQRVVRNDWHNYGVIPEGALGTICAEDIFTDMVYVKMDNPVYNLVGSSTRFMIEKLDVVAEQVEGDALQ